jgi:hypothetical protein
VKGTSNPFEELLVSLVRSGIEFITVGGIACAFSGYIRATEDVDILIRRNPENVRRLLDFLAGYGEGYGSELNESDFQDEEGAIRVVEEFPLDIFTVMGGQHYEELKQHIQLYELDGLEIPYLSTEGLIELKKGSVRAKDKVDVEALQALLDSKSAKK